MRVGTHLDWEHDGVTARMIDWFWSNMEKGIILWHPEQHEALEWAVPPKHGNPVGSIHIAPQTWDDGRRQNLYIRMERLEDVEPGDPRLHRVRARVIVAGLGLRRGVPGRSEADGLPHPPVAEDRRRRRRQVLRRSARGARRRSRTARSGRRTAAQEIGNWGVFLPQLYKLYQVVTDTEP